MSEHDEATKLAEYIIARPEYWRGSVAILASAVIDMAEEIEGLRSALDSIREQTRCNSSDLPQGTQGRCRFDEYPRHAPDCTWAIAEEAAVALAGPEQAEQESP